MRKKMNKMIMNNRKVLKNLKRRNNQWREWNNERDNLKKSGISKENKQNPNN